MKLVSYITKARLCLPRRGETALRVVDLYPPACKPYGLEAGSETACDYVIAGIVRGAKPTPKKRKMAKVRERFFAYTSE